MQRPYLLDIIKKIEFIDKKEFVAAVVVKKNKKIHAKAKFL